MRSTARPIQITVAAADPILLADAPVALALASHDDSPTDVDLLLPRSVFPRAVKLKMSNYASQGPDEALVEESRYVKLR